MKVLLTCLYLRNGIVIAKNSRRKKIVGYLIYSIGLLGGITMKMVKEPFGNCITRIMKGR